jgi:hypothetical protein
MNDVHAAGPEPAATDIDERDRRLLDYLVELAFAEAVATARATDQPRSSARRRTTGPR